MSATVYPIGTICGSMRYYESMLRNASILTADGWIILMPFVSDYVGGKESDKIKIMLDDMHFTKISMSERIFVIGSHIGESTKREIQYATEHGIPTTYIATT